MKKVVLILVALHLVGCAGRAPAPVAVVQAQDRYMDCAAITAEVQANNKRISELGKEEGSKVAQNVVVGAAGLFIPILWFGMDFQNAAGKEVAALQSRQQYLATLAEQRCGATTPVPVQNVQMTTPAPSATLGTTRTTSGLQVYKGKGTTDSWCQTPTMILAVNGDSIEGRLSETSDGKSTSRVKGTVANGQVALSFVGAGADFYTGEATGTLGANGVQLSFRTKTAKVCNYSFDLKPAPTGSIDD